MKSSREGVSLAVLDGVRLSVLGLAAGIGQAAGVGLAARAGHPPGADGHHHAGASGEERLWRNVVSGETVKGSFLAARTVDGALRVSIERENGDVVVFPMSELGEGDGDELFRRKAPQADGASELDARDAAK
jgi:hypothetical protein